MNDAPYGFRIVGDCRQERRLVDAAAALVGYAACDRRAEVDREAYLSAFQFGDEFRQHLQMTGSTKGYRGPCWSSWLWWDIDHEDDLNAAACDAQRLSAGLVERYGIDGDELLIFFSGSKGFHVGLPTSLWRPEPSDVFNQVARRFAEQMSERVGFETDTGVYDKVRAFRAPNSRHPKTGCHKRRLDFDELLHLKPSAIVQLAAEPMPFDLPDPPTQDNQAIVDWREAAQQVEQSASAHRHRRLDANGLPTLNRQTLQFIRDGAQTGDRHRLLFSAAANLGEFGCPAMLAHVLLFESALDSGLAPKEVRRQVECGLASVCANSTPQHAAETQQTTLSDR